MPDTTQQMPPGPGQMPPPEDIAAGLAAKQAAAGDALGPTETNVEALVAQMQAQMSAMAAQIQQLRTQAGPSGPHPLLATARNLRYHLADVEGSDAHAPGVQLADDLVEAAGHAVESGDLAHVRNIIGRLERFMRRVAVRPGDDHHGRAAREIISDHLPDQLDAFVPAPRQPGVASSQPPVRVTAGTVVSG